MKNKDKFHLSARGSKKTLCGIPLRTLGLSVTMVAIESLDICEACMKSTKSKSKNEVTQ